MYNKFNIIATLADTDFYKLTMQQVIFEKYANTFVRYDFKCRNTNILATVKDKKAFIADLNKELDHLCSLRYTAQEIKYLASIRFLKPAFIEFLKFFKLNREYIHVYEYQNDVAISVIGPWLFTIPFEVPVLAIVSELYSGHRVDSDSVDTQCNMVNNSNAKIQLVKDILSVEQIQQLNFNDMGTRRRYSYDTQRYILNKFKKEGILKGTSNVHFAHTLDIKVMGTMAHEYICAHQQLGRVEDCQKNAFQVWADVYRGDLGIALSDTVGFDAFLRDFDLYFAKLFDGCRHDSGNPYEWCDKLLTHYQNFHIDPKTKYAVFSDGLDFNLMLDLFRVYQSLINTSFGMGTNLTNDVGLKALQIVMKMTECNYRPVAKISDSAGKGMCMDASFEEYIKSIFKNKGR